MKNAEEWAKRIQKSKEPWADLVMLIQLDAFKAGIISAAAVVDDMRGEGENDLRGVRDRLRYTAEETTQLP